MQQVFDHFPGKPVGMGVVRGQLGSADPLHKLHGQRLKGQLLIRCMQMVYRGDLQEAVPAQQLELEPLSGGIPSVFIAFDDNAAGVF